MDVINERIINSNQQQCANMILKQNNSCYTQIKTQINDQWADASNQQELGKKDIVHQYSTLQLKSSATTMNYF